MDVASPGRPRVPLLLEALWTYKEDGFMRRTVLKLTGIFALLGAMAAMTPPPLQAAKVCNLLCIQGFHCCIVHGQAACVPESQPCK
jgi:hypothetical protein